MTSTTAETVSPLRRRMLDDMAVRNFSGMGKTDELYALSQANSVDLSRDGLRPLQDAAKDHQVVIVLGYQELDGSLSGSTLFNSCAIIDADGRLLSRFRSS